MTARDSTQVPGSATGVDVVPGSDNLGPGDQVGDYEIIRRLGTGGMGTVYAARHPLIGKQVAIKIVNSELSHQRDVRARFVTEARALTQIDHRNVVEVYSFGELAGGRAYLVMELAAGRSLRDIIKHDPLSLSEALAILEQITCGLAGCHERGIIHRDLKPANVFVFGRGAGLGVKLLDFGIAKVEGLRMSSKLTGEGVVLGTPAYMAPEQIRGGDVDERCDLYSLGVLAYEMFSGERPFSGPTCVDTLASALNKNAPPLGTRVRGCPRSLEALVGELMSKDRAGRPSIEQVRIRLAGIRAELETPPVLRARPSAPRPPWPARVWGAAPLVLVAVGLALAWMSLRATPLASNLAEAAADYPQIAPLPEPAVEIAAIETEIADTAEACDANAGAPAVKPERRVAAIPSPVSRRRAQVLAHPDALLDPFAADPR